MVENTIGVLHNIGKNLENIRKHPKKRVGNPHFWLYDVNSGSHVGHAQWYILYYCHSKKKARKKSWHVQNILPWRHLRSWPLPVTSLTVMAASGDVTSGPITSVTSGHACAMVRFPLKDPPEIWLEPYWYTTDINIFKITIIITWPNGSSEVLPLRGVHRLCSRL